MSKTLWIIKLLFFTSAIAIGQNFSGEFNQCGNDYLKIASPFLSVESNIQTNSDTVIYKIPVVFHVEHDGEHANIKRSEILSYLAGLNERFRRNNADTIDAPQPFLQFGDDTQIEFILATIDPEGNCIEGIVRHYNPLAWFGSYQDIEHYPFQNYLNIVLQRRQFACDGQPPFPSIACTRVGGYALFPQFVLYNNTNAVWVSYNMTSAGLAHEVGHWFNLAHLWSMDAGVGTPNPDCVQDDGVDDTPIQDGPTNGCPDFPYHTCDTDLGNMFSNYMDYSACPNMFTTGQRDRMWSALNSNVGGRNNLWTDANLMATGVLDSSFPNGCEIKPIADFGFGKYANYWCSGEAIPFWDASWGAASTEWSWTFEGGTPSASNEQNPFISYEESGIYEVTLISSNNFGSDTIIREVKITVFDEEPKYETQNLLEDFEESNFNFNEFYLFSDFNPREWSLVDTVSYSGQHSITLQFAQNYEGTNFVTPNLRKARYAFFTPEYDISAINSGKLSFYVAATSSNSVSLDYSQLGVFASTNCSEINELIQFPYEFNWDSLETYSGYANPLISDWKKITIDIPQEVFNYDKASFVFRYNSNYESNSYHQFARIYIDDIGIEAPDIVSTKDLNNKFIWQLIPNPTLQNEVRITGIVEGEIIIYDINGKIIHAQVVSRESKIDLSKFSNGTYFVNFRNEIYSDTKKLIIIK